MEHFETPAAKIRRIARRQGASIPTMTAPVGSGRMHMASDVLSGLIAQLRQANSEIASCLSDAAVLERFIATRDEAAFEVLVWRHGRLVLGVARRWLGDGVDAEDAFQAAFLTLARKAASVRHRPALAAWLHQVVFRIAMRARKRRARRQKVERPLAEIDVPAGPERDDELWRHLDAEVGRLPEKYPRVTVLSSF